MYEANPRITTTAPQIIDSLVVQDKVQVMVGDCVSKCSLQDLHCTVCVHAATLCQVVCQSSFHCKRKGGITIGVSQPSSPH